MPFLRKENGEQRGQCIELKGELFLIGRAPDCNLVLDPQGVSRRHAQIGKDSGQFYLEDLGSRNTTKLNNQTVAPWQRLALKPGDRINICDVEFVYLTRIVSSDPDLSEVIVTENNDESTLHTLDASTTRVSGSRVPPERKLEAVLDITRNLSTLFRSTPSLPRCSIPCSNLPLGRASVSDPQGSADRTPGPQGVQASPGSTAPSYSGKPGRERRQGRRAADQYQPIHRQSRA